jgi:hypothetical protein
VCPFDDVVTLKEALTDVAEDVPDATTLPVEVSVTV